MLDKRPGKTLKNFQKHVILGRKLAEYEQIRVAVISAKKH